MTPGFQMENKRVKYQNESSINEEQEMSLDDKILSSDIDNIIQIDLPQTIFPYHTSVCGSILHSTPSNSSTEIFEYLRHGNFDAFRRSVDVYYNEIAQMRNHYQQTVLHILAIHAYPYLWIRLMLMRKCDPCAQDNDGYTAAHYAVERDDVEMLKALTIRFHSQARPLPEAQIIAIHDQCLKALTLKEKNGLTVFMLACHREASKCLNYLIDLNINDTSLQDNYGDTCLHYATARRNQSIVEKLIEICKANVNGGDSKRPSALDVLQFNREQQKPFEQNKDDAIEKYLLSHNARNRCNIRRVVQKRKDGADQQTVASNLASLSIDSITNGQIETARSHARLASTLERNGNFVEAQTNYECAMNYATEESLDWACYAFQLSLIHQAQGEHQIALNLLQKALAVRQKFEQTSEEIDRLQQAIISIQQRTAAPQQ